ncbi:hypothetical protein J3D55_001068 [Chryseobacterium ginsenosidimutans]|nr:hypothetical protein [Chryseobacterium ginsenosidimutans]
MTVSLYSAQTYRFIYNYKSIPYTLRKDNNINEEMILDVDHEKSLFLLLEKNLKTFENRFKKYI